ncbi:hypothetical protein BVRB_5g105990 [Beta vulgaris subsp. vulgaris]|nr:hypothetical protein BVRB_5g105990 [Beta vulgaris subsp. vulgaris]
MASAAVDFLIQNILQLIAHKVELIIRVKGDIETLRKDLDMFKAFLKDCNKSENKTESIKELIKQIRDVTYKAEDAVESYVSRAAIQHETFAKRLLGGIIHLPKLATIGEEIASIGDDVKKVHGLFEVAFKSLSLQDTESSHRRPKEKKLPVVEKDDVVGFDVEAQNVIKLLNEGSEDLKIVTIVGMPGLGKTTLANKIYTDRKLEFDFMVRSWVYVSKKYTRKEVFLNILRDISGGTLSQQMHELDADELAKEVRCKLEKHTKFFVVMDDVWTPEAWTDLSVAFPKHSGGRILLTSRHNEVAERAQITGLYKLRFLTNDECLELLMRKVFRKEACPQTFKTVAQDIAVKCDGLPLAVVIIAGILLKKTSDLSWWTKIANKVSQYVTRDQEQCKQVVRLSYDNLPDHLKVCFLYFGVFPENFEIPAKKVILLWIAEGFIEYKNGESLEETAADYLEELVDKNLVLAPKRTHDGRIKMCRIHDMMHDLCKQEAEEENLFNVIKDPEDLVAFKSTAGAISMCRRLGIHSYILDCVQSNLTAARTRSFVSMAVEEVRLPLEHISFIPRAFQLLRILDVTSIIFERFPKELLGLVQLRYIAMAITFTVLPPDMSKLWNMQILMIKVISGNSLDIRADIWKMFQLRHLHTNVSANFVMRPSSKTKKQNHQGPSHIKTLTSISADSCTSEFLARIPTVTKLGIRGKLEELIIPPQGGVSTFEALATMKYLETLKIYGDVSSNARSKISHFPGHNKFPPNLRNLTVTDTMLSWEHMDILGMLPNLVMLKIKENAFMGEYWKPKDDGFRTLEVFYLGRTNLQKWEASNYHFPSLKKLILKFCDRLEGLSASLADISTLQLIDIHMANPVVAACARQIQKNNNGIGRSLQVSIYPPKHDCDLV